MLKPIGRICVCVCVSLAPLPPPQIFHWLFENKVFHRNKKINCSFGLQISLHSDRSDYGKRSGRRETTGGGLKRMKEGGACVTMETQSCSAFNPMPSRPLTCRSVSTPGCFSWYPGAPIHLAANSRVAAPMHRAILWDGRGMWGCRQGWAWWESGGCWWPCFL